MSFWVAFERLAPRSNADGSVRCCVMPTRCALDVSCACGRCRLLVLTNLGWVAMRTRGWANESDCERERGCRWRMGGWEGTRGRREVRLSAIEIRQQCPKCLLSNTPPGRATHSWSCRELSGTRSACNSNGVEAKGKSSSEDRCKSLWWGPARPPATHNSHTFDVHGLCE
jgi:hypothetical protein